MAEEALAAYREAQDLYRSTDAQALDTTAVDADVAFFEAQAGVRSPADAEAQLCEIDRRTTGAAARFHVLEARARFALVEGRMELADRCAQDALHEARRSKESHLLVMARVLRCELAIAQNKRDKAKQLAHDVRLTAGRAGTANHPAVRRIRDLVAGLAILLFSLSMGGAKASAAAVLESTADGGAVASDAGSGPHFEASGSGPHFEVSGSGPH